MEQIDTIMSKDPEEFERLELELFRIRKEDAEALQLMTELQDQETQRKKMLTCYQQYT